MSSRYNDYINAKTGEEASGMLVIKAARFPRGTRFATMFSSGLTFLATNGFTATELKVLLAMISYMEFMNFVRRKQKSIAKDLGMKPSNLSAVIKSLLQKGALARVTDPEDENEEVLRVSPHIAWKGNAKQYVAMLHAGEGTAFAPIPMPTKRRTATRKASIENKLKAA
jgi:DNA-binding MarR family transcriptional regulator